MQIVIHRINEIEKLKEVPHRFGCEIDIRANGSKLILNHEPFQSGDLLNDYLDNYRHGLLILNIKEAGIENFVLDEVKKRNITDYFLLDVEFPYLYRASRQGVKSIALRYSEDEPIEMLENYRNLLDWVWIDTNTILPLNKNIVEKLQGMKSCLVCPERWGRSQDIIPYRQVMKKLGFEPTAVMTNIKFINKWEQNI